MNRAAIVSSFAVSALTLLVVEVIAHYGYTGVRGIVILAVVAGLTTVTVGVSSAVAIALAFVVLYALNHVVNDRFSTVIILTAVAVIASLALEGGRAWRR